MTGASVTSTHRSTKASCRTKALDISISVNLCYIDLSNVLISFLC